LYTTFAVSGKTAFLRHLTFYFALYIYSLVPLLFALSALLLTVSTCCAIGSVAFSSCNTTASYLHWTTSYLGYPSMPSPLPPYGNNKTAYLPLPFPAVLRDSSAIQRGHSAASAPYAARYYRFGNDATRAAAHSLPTRCRSSGRATFWYSATTFTRASRCAAWLFCWHMYIDCTPRAFGISSITRTTTRRSTSLPYSAASTYQDAIPST